MAIRKEQFIEEEFYHVYNRGNSKQIIFHDHEDYQRFLDLLFTCNSIKQFNIFDIHKQGLQVKDCDRITLLVAIGSYCLMPNHFHILITPLVKGGLSKFLQKITTGYTMYFNNKYKHSGSLFQGKFKAEHINNDRYLKYIFSYIHLNPISIIEPTWKEKGIKNKENIFIYVEKYPYSSFKDYLHQSHKSIIDIKYFPNYFYSKDNFIKEILSWISYREARPHDV